MARTISRDDLLLLLDELEQGERSREELQDLIVELEFIVSDDEAIDILQDDELTSDEIANQLLGYDRDS